MGGNVSTAGDVYSFGILLLEMFTGKRPTEDTFKDGLNLHEFVKMALPDQVLEIADLRLLDEQKEEQEQDQEIEEEIAFSHIRSPEVERGSVFRCLVSLLGIGVACSVESPRERMLMKDVVNKMHVMRDMFLGAGIYREGRNKTLR
ncbi:putative receptor-like protein kinase At3g47110 [Magnolia sinica]|uniref:putative receptor-like protein kinase At3g47110 n=1 Tax=Magnolia sinica TaxID=86752 RepID=UPI002657F105|nr:putative receptor-like protein kinase At3g47110 [Magnolia sinica]